MAFLKYLLYASLVVYLETLQATKFKQAMLTRMNKWIFSVKGCLEISNSWVRKRSSWCAGRRMKEGPNLSCSWWPRWRMEMKSKKKWTDQYACNFFAQQWPYNCWGWVAWIEIFCLGWQKYIDWLWADWCNLLSNLLLSCVNVRQG